jgi:cytochrome bd-type quinol oxidase subunit 1
VDVLERQLRVEQRDEPIAAFEGIAFFVEAIFIGIYLYGWHRLPGRVHLLMLVPIAVAGVVGTFCILSVNAWMSAPAGFRLAGGEVVDVNPWAAMFNHAVWLMALHMWVATFMVVGFCAAAVYATGLLRGRDDRHHRVGFAVTFAFAAVAALFQPFIGHVTGARLAEDQPTKVAAIELADRTEGPAPLAIGGVLVDGQRRYSLDVPRLGSIFARNSPSAPVPGLDEFPADARPRDGLATMVHWSFQGMVAGGTALMLFGLVYGVGRRRGRDLLADACRRRALGAGLVTGAAALGGIVPLADDAPTLFDRLTGRGLPLILLSALAGTFALWALWQRRPAWARVGAVAAVASVLAGWGVAQYPWLLVDELEPADAAGADATLWGLVVAFALAGVTAVPALVYLYWVTQRGPVAARPLEATPAHR